MHRLARLLDTDHVAGRVTKGTVPHAVWLLSRFLDHLDVSGLHLFKRTVEIFGGEQECSESALGHHLGDQAALVVGEAGVADGG